MNTAFLLGNGFDLNLGLKTSYRDFYKYYCELGSVESAVARFKGMLSENFDNWSDLEVELGKYSRFFNKDNENQFVKLLYDIQDNLADYLDKQDTSFTISDTDKRKAYDSLTKFENFFTARERQEYYAHKRFYSGKINNINIISFNYTKTFEKIYNWKGKSIALGNNGDGINTYIDNLASFEHIHGTTDLNMIMGVNDATQIANDELRRSLHTVRSIVKTEMNMNAGTLRDNRCRDYISQADVVCIYGMSMGETDSVWWELVGKWLLEKPHATLVIFSKVEEISARRSYLATNIKEEVKNKFLTQAKIEDKHRSLLAKRIFVSLNSNMFDIKLLPPNKDGYGDAARTAIKFVEDMEKNNYANNIVRINK